MEQESYYKNFLKNNPYPRKLQTYENNSSPLYLTKNGRKLINFSSNDYLGLANHPLLIERTIEFAERYGASASSSRSVTGNAIFHEEIEQKLAVALNKPAAIILGTGFQTNTFVLESLLDPNILGEKPLVFCDRLIHSSMIATTRYITRLHRFSHNDLSHLELLLEKYSDSSQPKFILTESVFSMDGDQINLPQLIALAKKHKAFLYVDDAHAVGVYGKNGWGFASEAPEIDVVMGTFSKALGGFGGYIGCSETVRDFLINKCKGLIYSTGLPPAVWGAIAAAIDLLPSLELQRKQLLKNSARLREFFQKNKLNIGQSTTHIIPWIIEDAKKTLRISEALEREGIIAGTIRPPSVPLGQSRIRFCLSAGHTENDLNQLISAVQKTLTIE